MSFLARLLYKLKATESGLKCVVGPDSLPTPGLRVLIIHQSLSPTVGTLSMALVSDTCRPARLLAVSNAAEFCVNTITVITDCCIR